MGRLAVPALAALALWALLWWPILGRHQVLYYGDLANQNLPLRLYVARHLARGLVPLWCPDLFTGIPLVADQGGLYAPATWLLALRAADAPRWFSLLTAAVYLVAWSGTWALARRLGLGRAPAFFAATAYAYCSPLPARHVFTNMLEAMALLPWLLLGVEATLTARHPAQASRATLLTAAAVGLQMLSFYPQVTFYSLLAVALYAAFRRPGPRPRCQLAWLAGGLALGLALGAAQYLPTLELIRWNHAAEPRGAAYVLRYAPRARQLIGLALPGFWGKPGVWLGGGNFAEAALPTGVTVLALVLLALRLPASRFPKLPLLILTVTAAAISLPTISQVHRLFVALPGLGSMRALGRCWFVASLAMALLAAWAAQQLQPRPSASRPLAQTTALLASLLIPFILAASLLANPRRSLALAALLRPHLGDVDFLRLLPPHWQLEYGCKGAGTVTALGALAALAAASWAAGHQRRGLAIALLCASLFAEGFHTARLSIPTAQPQAIYSQPWTANVIAAQGPGRIFRQPASTEAFLTLHPDLNDAHPSFARHCSALLADNRPLLWSLSCADGYLTKVFLPRDVVNLFRVAGLTPDAWSNPAYAQSRGLVLALLSVRWCVGLADGRPEAAHLRLHARRWPAALWHVSASQPLARLVGAAPTASSLEQVLAEIAHASPSLFQAAPAEIPAALAKRISPHARGTVHILSAQPGLWRLSVQTPTGGLLVVTDRAYPGWRAILDGHPAWWGRAYGVLKCLYLPPGTHYATLIYWPTAAVLGQFLMLAATIAALAILTTSGFSSVPAPPIPSDTPAHGN
jgi:hypothetical protein